LCVDFAVIGQVKANASSLGPAGKLPDVVTDRRGCGMLDWLAQSLSPLAQFIA
jgi:hypothetical protein